MKKSICIIMILIFSFSICQSSKISYAAVNNEYVNDAKELYEATGAFAPDTEEGGNVTRSDFLVALISALTYDVDVKNYKQYFLDVEPDSQLGAAIEYGLRLNIISPEEKFYPEDNITNVQCMKMMVSALGYDIDAMQSGGYPTGYLTKASQFGLTRHVSFSSDDFLDMDNFYVLMRNFFEATIRVSTAFDGKVDNVTAKVDNAGSVLEELYHWNEFDGIISSNENTGLYEASNVAAKDCIVIDGITYSCNFQYALGSHVIGYSKEIDGIETIVFIEMDSDTSVVSLTPRQIDSVLHSKIDAYKDNEKSVKYNFSSVYSVIYNGKASPGLFDNDDFELKSGKIELIDNNGDNKFEVIHVYDSKIMCVGNVNDYNEFIYDKYSGESINISQNANVKVYSNGSLSSISQIKVGGAIEFYRSADNDYVEIHILQNSLDGALTGISGDKESVFIDGKEYYVSYYFTEHNLNTLNIGDTNTYFLNEAGEVACISKFDDSNAIFAYASKFLKPDDLDECMLIRLFNEHGELLTLETDKKVKLNNQTKKLSGDELYNLLSPLGEQTIRYKINSANKIVELYTEDGLGIYDPTLDSKDMLKRFNFNGYDTSTKVTYKSFGLFLPYFTINSSTKIITVQDKELARSEKDRFSVGSVSSWDNDTNIESNMIFAYNVNKSGVAKELVCLSGSTGSTVSAASKYGVVSSIEMGIDSMEDIAYKVTLCASNKYNTYFVPLDSAIVSNIVDENGKYVLKCGDFVRYIANVNLELTGIFKDFDVTSGDVLHETTRENAELNYYYGTLEDYEGNSLSMTLIDSSKKGSGYIISMIFNKSYVWMVDTKDNSVSAVVPSFMTSSAQSIKDYDKVLLKTRYAEIQDVVIYK